MIVFPEGYVWPGRRVAWLALVNPRREAQTVTVTLLQESGELGTRTTTVGPRGRVGLEVGAWFGLTRDTAFGLEVGCAGCAASLVMWDAAYTWPAASVPVEGCR